MDITGTIRTPNAETSHLTASGATYDEALDASLPDDAQLIAIRTAHS